MANEQESNIIKDQTQSQDSKKLDSPTPTSEPISSNKRIAKNAIMLYIRMFLSMIVGLYTSRVVLNTLGVVDYGIYGVVGGVVSIMGFLNASMAGATSRFITFELGKGNNQRIKDTFSSALIIHIGIALIVFVLAETIGLWFLNNKLDIPEERMHAAHWVYQMSILSTMLGITQAPYNACIIAHERMGVFAYIEILNVTLKLLIVYLLVIGEFDKLILYSILTFAISVIIIMIYRIYCIHKFQECHFNWIWNKEILRPLLSFSGWDLYGNMCVTARVYGSTFLVNMFFGVILNAAYSLSNMVYGVIVNFSSNVIQAFRPQIIKLYAINRYDEFNKILRNAIIYTIIFFAYFAVPLLLETNYLFDLWLSEVPAYSVLFCKLMLIAYIFDPIINVLNISIHSTGKIKLLSLCGGTMHILYIPILYVVFNTYQNPTYMYIVLLFVSFCILLSSSIIVCKLIPKIKIKCIFTAIIKIYFIIAITYILCYSIQSLIPSSISRLIIMIISSTTLLSLLSYFLLLDNDVKELIKNRIKYISKF